MEQSPRLALSYLQPQQAQKHVTVNESFRRLDALVGLAVKSRTTDAEPASPAEGDAFIMTASPSGAAWSAYGENTVAAFQDGAWAEITPAEGLRAWVSDEGALYAFAANAWSALNTGGGGAPSMLGVNTTADATNRLAVKSDAVLFAHDDVTPGSGDCRVKIDKETAGDTGSLVFQTGASGRAEIGLSGDDEFHIKVSADGAAWTEALVIDKDTARLGFGTNAPATRIHVVGPDAFGSRLTVERAGNSSGIFGAFNGLFVAASTPVDTASISFWTTQAGPIDTKRMEVFNNGGVVIGSPSGGSKGAGTLNAAAVYDDNALLSCYVFDQALDGAIDPAKWDGKTPAEGPVIRRRIVKTNGETADILEEAQPKVRRRHEPMRKFSARIGGKYDPLTLDGYARHWKEKRHLTAMPNETAFDAAKGMAAGEWIQRLVETVEIQAVLIEQLNQRLKALETR